VTRIEIECAVNKAIPQTCPGESSISRKCQEATATTRPEAWLRIFRASKSRRPVPTSPRNRAPASQPIRAVPAEALPSHAAHLRLSRFARCPPRPTPSHAAHLRLNVRFARCPLRPTPSHAAHLRLNVRFARCPPRPKARTVPPLRWRGSCGRATEASIHHPLQEAESEHTAASLVPQLSSTHIFLLFAASRRALDLAGVPILSTP
jgi:hypothetical protein